MKFQLVHLFTLAAAAGVACGISLFTHSRWYGYVTFSILFYVVLILQCDESSYYLSGHGRKILGAGVLSLASTSCLTAIDAYVTTAWTEPGGNAVWMFTPEVAAIYAVVVILYDGLLFLCPTVLLLWLLGKSRKEPVNADEETR